MVKSYGMHDPNPIGDRQICVKVSA